jgi:prepilin-type N-terminal cleavage/methylation domain-containing protein
MSTRREGFTLLELIVVIVIVAILASLGITRFKSTRDRATLTTMKSDLKVLSIYQELQKTEHGTYADSLPIQDQFTTPGVEVQIVAASSDGWAATAKIGVLECAMFMGDAPATAPATEAGVIGCTE